MDTDVDEATALLNLLDRINELEQKNTISNSLAANAKRKINDDLVELFPPPPPPD